jgi:hypothetical protein
VYNGRVPLPRARLAAAAAGAFVLLGLWLARPAPITAPDQEQPRLDQAAPIPRATSYLEQTLVARHNGLSAVEVLAVVYPEQPPGATLTLRLFDGQGQVVAQADFSGLAHNAPLRLEFPPQPRSAGAAYTLQLAGSADNHATAWAYSLDGYAAGGLHYAGAPTGGDLRFSTTYTYRLPGMLADSARMLGRLAPAGLQLWLLLFVPGLLLLRWLRPPGLADLPAWARWGLALGLSLAVLALVWLWAGVLGLRLSPAALAVACAAALLALVVERALPLRRQARAAPPGPPLRARLRSALGGHNLAMGAVLFGGLAARLLAARDLALPAWVDSPHHALIARLLDQAGRVPADYAPLLPIDTFTYHFGLHALAVSLSWLSPLSIAEALLLGGQVLNALVPLAAYTLAAGLRWRPHAALAAAFLVAFVSFFPAYYLSWGRYSQLAGLLLLGPAAAALWLTMAGPARQQLPPSGGRQRLGRAPWLITAAILAAGLLLAHYRVFIFFCAFAVVALALAPRLAAWRAAGGVAALGGLLALPWLLRLGRLAVWPVVAEPARLAIGGYYNEFPLAYFQAPLERAWLLAAVLAAAWGLLRRERQAWLLAGWVGLVFAVLNLAPPTWLVNNNAWAISLFMPAAVVLGWGIDRWLAGASRLACAAATHTGAAAGLRAALAGLMLAGLAGAGGFALRRGLAMQVSVLNQATVLALPEDVEALDWVSANVPEAAVFATNGWLWLHETWAGSDGGAWLLAYAGRHSLLPPLDYINEAGAWRDSINAFNAQAAHIQDASAPETRALLRSAGVTHVFIGARGGSLRPEMFAGSPHYRLAFTNGAAWVFALAPD